MNISAVCACTYLRLLMVSRDCFSEQLRVHLWLCLVEIPFCKQTDCFERLLESRALMQDLTEEHELDLPDDSELDISEDDVQFVDEYGGRLGFLGGPSITAEDGGFVTLLAAANLIPATSILA